MPVSVIFECSGCWEKKTNPVPLRRRFEGFNGKSYGFGRYVYDRPQDVVPDGWLAYDPYTGCCYCPECWKSIEQDSEEVSDERE